MLKPKTIKCNERLLEQFPIKNIDKLKFEIQMKKKPQKLNTKEAIASNNMLAEFRLAKTVIKVLDIKARAGCNEPSWIGYSNGNGTEIGVDIERLIKQAKRLLANFG